MGRGSEERVQEARSRISERQLLAQIAAMPAAPGLLFHADGFDVIAELKLVSPAAGPLTDRTDRLAERVGAYARGGAAAVSVLTEPSRFGGSLDHLQEAATTLLESGVPVMRKDFLVSPYQVLEARAAGAGGVLVILAMLDDASCRAIIDTALEHGMFVLLEAFDPVELERAGELLASLPQTDQLLLGLNCRDLRSLQVDTQRFASAVEGFPAGCRRVAESGIDSPAMASWARKLGYDVALVGTALMRSSNPEEALAELLAAGRVVPGAGK
jgi:indole-3-glycerol phosphate synthase